MVATNYLKRRNELEEYFDRTAAKTWEQLTSDAPVSRIRSTVRAGRDHMRETLLQWLPADMKGIRFLDAGCGPGQMAIEVARRGADVLAIDLSKSLLDVAADRAGALELDGSVKFIVGDMLNPPERNFDFVVAMDSLIHYQIADFGVALDKLRALADKSCFFTFAPRTPALGIMHNIGKLFPRNDRSPAIEPHRQADIRALIKTGQILRSKQVKSGFYVSHAMEVSR